MTFQVKELRKCDRDVSVRIRRGKFIDTLEFFILQMRHKVPETDCRGEMTGHGSVGYFQ